MSRKGTQQLFCHIPLIQVCRTPETRAETCPGWSLLSLQFEEPEQLITVLKSVPY